MSEETLLSAARRVVRNFNIDMNHGGLVSTQTQAAIDTLDNQVRKEAARQKALDDYQRAVEAAYEGKELDP
jgi:hypothetical protein